ncbi:hypothetical protein L1987_66685 [Smallanthus sonchifolius]|uniref:Uncharacterized protein n=1 Tax=Smallanthus sonchifolius TaxID=185202 RepID=A0ACB9BY67_9ASTR|nr:hypothetical protein L1987_66685 [Smallanthus sonchifolius]
MNQRNNGKRRSCTAPLPPPSLTNFKPRSFPCSVKQSRSMASQQHRFLVVKAHWKIARQELIDPRGFVLSCLELMLFRKARTAGCDMDSLILPAYSNVCRGHDSGGCSRQ